MNFYVMDKRETGIRAVGWSPPKVGDFHVPRRFGKLTFAAPATEGAKAEPAAPKAADKPKSAKATKPAAEKKGATAQAEH